MSWWAIAGLCWVGASFVFAFVAGRFLAVGRRGECDCGLCSEAGDLRAPCTAEADDA